MTEESLELEDQLDDDIKPLGVITLPTVIPPTEPFPTYAKSSGKKIDISPVRYEVVRMILDGMSFVEISEVLRTLYHVKVTELTLAAFKKNYFSYYKDFVDRIDKARHAHLVARITEEMKLHARGMVHEVFELQAMLSILDESVGRLRALPDARRSAAYEGALKDFILAKARILERITKVTGSSGLEEKLKDVIRETALIAQKTLIQYLREEDRDKAFTLFDQELRTLLESVESGLETTPPPE
jgi:hypothetical protein